MVLIGMLMTIVMIEKDIHSYGNPGEVQQTHLSLDLSLDFDQKVIHGICDIHLTYPDAGKTVAHLDLDTSQLEITAVTAGEGGKALKFELGPEQKYMGRRLRIHLDGSKPEKVRVAYKTSPGAKAVQWLDPQQTTSGKYPFLFTQSQAILARTWIPCMDSPGARVTYDAVVRVPKEISAVMSAEHLNHEPEKGIYRFKMPQAIPSYLIALAAGELSFEAISDRTGVYAEPAVLKKAVHEFADMEKMVKVTEDLYGAYDWGRWDIIVLPPSFPFGGMENPRLTFATPTILAGDRSLVSLLAHELAHSWSGNLVTNATWDDFWINEGFTTYIERRIVEGLYGKDVAEMQKRLGQRDLHESLEELGETSRDTHLRLDLAGRDPDDGMTDIAYEKGANLLLMLETNLGRDKFDGFLKKYFKSNAFKNMTTTRLLELMKRDLFDGDEARWKELQVEKWVYGPGIPNNIVVPKSDHFNKTKAAAAAFAESGATEQIKKDKWTTYEWLDFLNSLPETLSGERLAALDQKFNFTNSGNSEILFAWMRICIRNNHQAAYPALEDFLVRQGRRKFLKPLYEDMMANPNTVALAKKVYQKARPGYHPISSQTIDGIVK